MDQCLGANQPYKTKMKLNEEKKNVFYINYFKFVQDFCKTTIDFYKTKYRYKTKVG